MIYYPNIEPISISSLGLPTLSLDHDPLDSPLARIISSKVIFSIFNSGLLYDFIS